MAEYISDRRNTQRVDANLKLEIKLPLADGSEEAASLETVNISSSGIYFRSKHCIEPMTKLEMGLEVRVPSRKKTGQLAVATVRCEGIVVRVTPENGQPEDGLYEIAVFFTQISPEGLRSLEEHITLLLEAVP